MPVRNLKVGDKVIWNSHAQGAWTQKAGTVVAVVPPHTRVQSLVPQVRDPGGPRDHESYVVNVPTPSGKGIGTFYWPRVNNLKRI